MTLALLLTTTLGTWDAPPPESPLASLLAKTKVRYRAHRGPPPREVPLGDVLVSAREPKLKLIGPRTRRRSGHRLVRVDHRLRVKHGFVERSDAVAFLRAAARPNRITWLSRLEMDRWVFDPAYVRLGAVGVSSLTSQPFGDPSSPPPTVDQLAAHVPALTAIAALVRIETLLATVGGGATLLRFSATIGELAAFTVEIPLSEVARIKRLEALLENEPCFSEVDRMALGLSVFPRRSEDWAKFRLRFRVGCATAAPSGAPASP